MCCSVCGGLTVERKVWAEVNTDEVIEDAVNGDEDTWCRDCEAHTGLMYKLEWDSQNGKE